MYCRGDGLQLVGAQGSLFDPAPPRGSQRRIPCARSSAETCVRASSCHFFFLSGWLRFGLHGLDQIRRRGTFERKAVAHLSHDALLQVHADAREFVLHFDIDVIAQEDFPAVNVPGSGGLRLDGVRTAFVEFAKHKNLIGLDVAQYNPEKDPDGSGASKLVDLLVEVLSARLEALSAGPADSSASSAEVSSSETTA